MNKEQPFTPLELPQKHLLEVGNSLYLVFSDRTKYVQVEAPNAQSAILASGVDKPVRVLRQDLSACSIISIKGKCNNGIDLNAPPPLKSSVKSAAEPTVETDASASDQAPEQTQEAAQADAEVVAEEAVEAEAGEAATEQSAPPVEDSAGEEAPAQ